MVLAPDVASRALVQVTGWVYFATATSDVDGANLRSTIQRVAKSGGEPQDLFIIAGRYVSHLVIDATHVYVTTTNTFDASATQHHDTIWRGPREGGASCPLLGREGSPKPARRSPPSVRQPRARSLFCA